MPCSSPAASGEATGTADDDYDQITFAFFCNLFIPQDMSGRKFVKIVTTAGKTFYYIPASGTANFFSGKMYEYRLTVTSEGIKDTGVEGGTWLPAE